MDIKIAPSLLSADFGRLQEEINEVEDFSDLIHFDVMDGNFVPNLTFGALVLKRLKSKKPFDCHLMVQNPDSLIEDFSKAGAKIITVHAEACVHLHRTIQLIKSFNCKAGVALNPHSSISLIENVLDDVDMILLMTVNPGFGGQKFIDGVLPKIKRLRELKPNLDIEVDGGVNKETIKKVVEAGANVIVAGSAVFDDPDRKKAIEELRAAISIE